MKTITMREINNIKWDLKNIINILKKCICVIIHFRYKGKFVNTVCFANNIKRHYIQASLTNNIFMCSDLHKINLKTKPLCEISIIFQHCGSIN